MIGSVIDLTIRLATVAARLASETGILVETVPADLTDRAQRVRVEERLRSDPSITLLVNNARMSIGASWLTAPPGDVEAVIALNAVAPTLLAKAAATALAARGGGAIVNIGSVAAFAPELLDGAYAATRAHLLALTLAITAELGDRVYAQAVLFGTVHGEPPGAPSAGSMIAPEEFVDAALVGVDRRETLTVPSLHDDRALEIVSDARSALVADLRNDAIAPRYRAPGGDGRIDEPAGS